MPNVEQHDWDKLKPTIPEHKPKTAHKVPERNNKVINAEVKLRNINFISTLPKPFTCSKCNLDAESRKALDDHWLLEH